MNGTKYTTNTEHASGQEDGICCNIRAVYCDDEEDRAFHARPCTWDAPSHNKHLLQKTDKRQKERCTMQQKNADIRATVSFNCV